MEAFFSGGLWLDLADIANDRAARLAAGLTALPGVTLLHPVEANMVFLRLSGAERAALRAQGFGFYDHGEDGARIVTAWNSRPGHVAALARAIAAL